MDLARSSERLILPTLEAGPLHSFIGGCFAYHLAPHLEPQLYVLTCLMSIVAAYALLYSIRKICAGRLWIFRVQSKDARRIFIASMTLFVHANGGSFAILFFAQTYGYMAVGKGITSDALLRFLFYAPLASFVLLVNTAWGCLAVIVHSTPGILCDSDLIWPSSHRSKISAPLLNLFFFGPPLITTGFSVTFAIRMGSALSKSYRQWQTLQPQLLSLPPNAVVSEALAAEARQVWQTWCAGIWDYTIGMSVWTGVGASLLVLGLCIYALSERTMRCFIREYKTQLSAVNTDTGVPFNTRYYPAILLPSHITWTWQESGASAEALSHALPLIHATLVSLILLVSGLIALAGLKVGGMYKRATMDPITTWTYVSQLFIAAIWLTVALGSVVVYVTCSDVMQPLLEGYGKRTKRVSDEIVVSTKSTCSTSTHSPLTSLPPTVRQTTKSSRSFIAVLLKDDPRQARERGTMVEVTTSVRTKSTYRTRSPVESDHSRQHSEDKGEGDSSERMRHPSPEPHEEVLPTSSSSLRTVRAASSSSARPPAYRTRAASNSSSSSRTAGSSSSSPPVSPRAQRFEHHNDYSRPGPDRPWYFAAPAYEVQSEMNISDECAGAQKARRWKWDSDEQ